MTNAGLPRAASGHVTRWHMFVELNGREIVGEELLAAMKAPTGWSKKTPNKDLILLRYAEWTKLKEQAERGELVEEEDNWDPVVSQPTIWELRLWRGVFGRPGIRVYFSEPVSHPRTTIVALAHAKPVEMTNPGQNKLMAVAAERVDLGGGWLWGCPECKRDCCT